MEATGANWIARSEALARLKVKTQTLYAYVSRGRIAARPDPADPRRSLYAAADVERLSAGGGGATASALPSIGAPGRGEAAIDSGVSIVIKGRLFYRGQDAVQLAERATLEDAARVLWDMRQGNPFADLKPRVDVAFAGAPRGRALSFMARRASEDAPAAGREYLDLAREAAAVLAELVDAVAGAGPRLHLHQRLARAWKLADRDVDLLRRALVLCADEGLDDAVLATRVAAGGGASLAASTLAGMAAMTGPGVAAGLHASVDLVAAARGKIDGLASVSAPVIAALRPTPLAEPDPRAASLIQAADLPPDLLAVAQGVRGVTGRGADLNLALALVARRMDLPRTGACDIWLIARAAGLLAHALDQVTNGSPIRARLRYVGVEPGAH